MSPPSPLFVPGIELASLVASSDLLNLSWDANLAAYNEQNSQALPVRWHIVTKPNCTIVAFVTSPVWTLQHLCQQGGSNLVSSQELEQANFPHFRFLCSEGNPSFSIHGAVASFFQGLQLSDFDNCRKQLIDLNKENTPLIISGHVLGGSLACLFTLCLLDAIGPKSKKLPFCITFGAPLVGDKGFQQAISEHSKWNSRFLHVASNHDPVPRLFASREHLQQMELDAQTGSPHGYSPFGTFLFWSESGSACVDDPEVVSLLLLESSMSQVFGQELSLDHYGEVVKHMKSGISCKGSSQIGVPVTGSLRSGLFIQLAAAGLQIMQVQNSDILRRLEDKENSVAEMKAASVDPSKKLNEVKKKMAQLEWYKKNCKVRGIGYYDGYKERSNQRDNHVTTIRKYLTNYWKTIVSESVKKPQKEGEHVRMAWLYAGTNYRRMVEPLDIAEHYGRGDQDYENRGRSEHYILLEKWQQEDPEKNAGAVTEKKKQNVGGTLTEDSLFWARVEEALIRCRILENVSSSVEKKEESAKYLQWFGNYVMDEINKYAVSPEVFLEQTSFMRWWREFQQIGEAFGTCNPSLLRFMNNGLYKQYEAGKY